VIGADTVVLTHPPPGAHPNSLPGWRADVLEKPQDREDQLRMLLDMNGGIAEVVTGVVVVWPVLVAPGWQVKLRIFFLRHFLHSKKKKFLSPHMPRHASRQLKTD
jgi:hypothetical protein